MLLTIDVGNTETKLGIFEKNADDIVYHWRVTTEAERTADEYGVFITQLFATVKLPASEIDAVAIASVVPRLDRTLHSVCERFFRVTPQYLEPHKQQLMAIRTDHPEEVGADLVACAIGGRARYGAPLIVISYGTATVFTAVSQQGEYCGVAIAPGINISIDALAQRTAKLPQVSLEAPTRVMGRNTVEALRAGFVYGFVGQTEAIVHRMRSEMGVDARVVATGGLAEVIAKNTPLIESVDPYLSLAGLELFYRSLSGE
jgi:type III pantothenate kinase